MKGSEAIRELNDAHAKVFDVVINVPFYQKLLEQVIEELNPNKDGIYLDAGCGTGNLLKAAKSKEPLFVGVDFSKEMLKKARGKSRYLIMADLHHLPFKEDSIDGITNVNVFYQLKHPVTFLEEVYKVLKPSSKLIITTPREGASFAGFLPEFLKSIIRKPKILKNLRKMIEYGRINKKIINANPNTFYSKEELIEMLRDFEIEKIEKVYVGQNWLISAYKPVKAESKN
jgi:ubiquinone/menaquinone biosynthesis C-methylase UbiE